MPFTERPGLIEGVGLLSSVEVSEFSQMILDHGVFEGQRILKKATAEMIYKMQFQKQLCLLGIADTGADQVGHGVALT